MDQTNTAAPRRDDPARPLTEFDHHIPDGADPEAAWGGLRRETPVAWSSHHGGYWIVTRHQDVSQVLKDHRTFSSARNEHTGDGMSVSHPPKPLKLGVPEELDPPEFLPYKRILAGLLAPHIVADELGARVRHWVDWHLDEIVERGECDLVYDLASPVSGAIALEWIGFPPEDWRRISKAFHDVVGSPHGRITEEIALCRRELAAGRPRRDVMGQLVSADIDGAPMTDEMAEAMVRLLVGGGVDTTSATIASALVHLYRHPDQRQALRDDPPLWGTAVEEFIRRYPPILAHARTVVADTEVGGCPMRAGERIVASEASACWDEEQFDRADEVVLDRFPNRHVAFGLGIHRCPGMHLARVLFRETVAAVIERIPDYRVDDRTLRRYATQSTVSGWVSVPVTFTPGRRLLGDRQTRSAT
jgi:cytochrome P450